MERAFQGISAAGFKVVGLGHQAAGRPLFGEKPTSAELSDLRGNYYEGLNPETTSNSRAWHR